MSQSTHHLRCLNIWTKWILNAFFLRLKVDGDTAEVSSQMCCLDICVAFAVFVWWLFFFSLAQAHEDSRESLNPLPHRDIMGSFLPDSSAYELRTVIGEVRAAQYICCDSYSWWVCVSVSPCVGRGLEDLMTVNLAVYKPTGEYVAIRRIDLDSCANDMVSYLQVSEIESFFLYINCFYNSSFTSYY